MSALRPLLLTGVAAALVAGCGVGTTPSPVSSEATASGPAAGDARPTVVVHRTETCPCCGSYEEHLELRGFEVQQRMHEDLAPVRAELGVPEDQASCHTSVIDGYVAEGHLPVAALEDLLERRPDIDGIALAGMPSGSPGMGGPQLEPFEVAALEGGAVSGIFGSY